MHRIVIPVLMGLESVVSDELLSLGYQEEAIRKENGLVILIPDQEIQAIRQAVARCNLFLRCAERVELEIASFQAETFDELFEQVQTIPWADYVEKGAAIQVKGYSRDSKLFAPSALQSTIKKGIVLALQRAWHIPEDHKIPEDRDFQDMRLNYAIMKNQVFLRMDTSGEGLHKRGYRRAHNAAPIRETLAAGIIKLSRWEPFSGEVLYDPCCGSGTFPAEAALLAANVAPGSRRSFRGETWPFLGREPFQLAREEALDLEDLQAPSEIFIAGSDIDGRTLDLARENAARAGVAQFIELRHDDLYALSANYVKQRYLASRVLFVANPPYGERMQGESEHDIRDLNQAIGRLAFDPDSKYTRPGVRLSVITSADFEEDTGRKADKRRKLYNGMIKSTMYHYFREKRI